MNILGIETSCDETAAAVVKNGRGILSNIIATSLKEHKKYGGIIPEIASRRQLQYINTVVRQSLSEARLDLKHVDAIAVTNEPGLIGSLLVGTSFACALSMAIRKPLIRINHIKAHLYANFLTDVKNNKNRKPFIPPKLPAVGLVVSGGHTSLYHISRGLAFKLIGATRDDAAGEAFDKVARILELGYPGGPVIDRLAKKEKKSNIRFTCAPLTGTLDFSFSGIKTAVLYHKRDHQYDTDYSVSKIAKSFQDSVVTNLVQKSIRACEKQKVNTLVVGGGVAANSQLREQLMQTTEEHNITVHFPAMALCVDNAAMVAGLAYKTLKSNGLRLKYA